VGSGKLQADRERLTFSRRFRKSRWRLQEIQVSAEEHVLVVRAANDEEAVFELAPVELQFRLESGKVEVSLCAEDLAARVQAAPRP
jgi:formylmethanofuran dehydrogenase subunit E